MTDAFAVLGLPEDADVEAIRRRYLALVRQYPPERAPERFAAIRAAYDALKDGDERLRSKLFDRGRKETIDALIEEVACRSSRRRVPLETMLQALRSRR